MSSKLISGIREVRQFMKGEGNFLLAYAPAFLRLLQSLGAPEYMDYNFVMAVSGAATRLSWQQGWAAYEGEPNQSELFVNGDRLIEVRRGFAGAGVEYTICLNEAQRAWWSDNYSGEVAWVDGAKAKSDIVASIDRGVPVLSHGMDGPTSLIIGYENDGAQLCHIHPFIPDADRRGEARYTVTRSDWQSKITMYCLVRSFSPRSVDRALIQMVMRHVVSLAQLESYGTTALGLNAIDALVEQLVWDEGFEMLAPQEKYEGVLSWPYERPAGFYREDGARNLHDRFWAGYCDFLCMMNGYEAIRFFMEKHKDVVPAWTEDLLEASRCAKRVCDYTGELWKYVSADEAGLLKFKTADVRSIFAAHMLRAKVYTKRMVEIFERLLKVDLCMDHRGQAVVS